jgi:hypothetical protein
MRQLLQSGYILSSVTESVVGQGPTQDLLTTFYLMKGTDLVRCTEGTRLSIKFGWILACQRLSEPFELK